MVNINNNNHHHHHHHPKIHNNSTTTSSIGNTSSNKVEIAIGNEEKKIDWNQKYNKNPRNCLGRTIRKMMNIKLLIQNVKHHWKGSKDFGYAQLQVLVVLTIAYIGNNWPYSYHRNLNENPPMFWVMNIMLLVAGLFTLKHDSQSSASQKIQLLSRSQTEEWKGWMQWGFIMYHYYRMYAAYNEIRVYVSAYVWMTGFGNFLYFDKAKDFSLERAVSMWLRINYFPVLLSVFINVPLELYYVVPLHTVGFFVTMATCFLSHKLEYYTAYSSTKRNAIAIAVCLLIHILFYETPAVNLLKFFSDEYFFRFQSDKYSAWVGILSGFGWFKFREYMQWCYHVPEGTLATKWQIGAMWAQRLGGLGLLAFWYFLFGHIQDKFVYNPIHPYIFWIPVAGWLMLRNSSKYLTEVHAGAMEFFGRITLETYVLQFHVFMCNKVQHIPIVVPGSGQTGSWFLKTLNMLVCGVGFVALAFWARQITVTTQESATELVGILWRGPPPSSAEEEKEDGENLGKNEMVSLVKTGSNESKDSAA